jgi:hypothetical protein
MSELLMRDLPILPVERNHVFVEQLLERTLGLGGLTIPRLTDSNLV